MDKVVAAVAAQQDELGSIVSSLDEAGWQHPSRCDGWSVADVVLHLAQTDEMAVASLQGRFGEVLDAFTAAMGAATSSDDGAAHLVASERGEPGPALLRRWQASANALLAELRDADPGRRVAWVAGELSAQTLATTRLTETWIHTGDVAVPLGHEEVVDDRLWHIARLAWRTLPYAFGQAGYTPEGPVAFALVAPGGETWHFEGDDGALTTITGPAVDLCRVAGQRARAGDTALEGDGPDAAAVLDLVRTFA